MRGEGPGNGDTLALAAAEFVGKEHSHVGVEPYQLQHFPDTLADRLTRHVGVDLQGFTDDITHPHTRA